MNRDISAHIADLLYLNDIVIVPGFGGFEATYQAAAIDFVSGHIAPPKKSLRFSENLVINDGLLVAHVAEANKLSQKEAKECVGHYVESCKHSLLRGDFVVIPKVGKIYKNLENQTQFIAENTNFLSESFGLNTVRYYPILRAQRIVHDHKAESAASPDALSPIFVGYKNLVKYALPVSAVVLLLFIVGMSLNNKNEQPPVAVMPTLKKPVSEMRINEKPSTTAAQGEREDETTFVLPEKAAPAPIEPTDAVDEEEGGFDGFDDTPITTKPAVVPKPAAAPEKNNAATQTRIIAVGVFQLDYGVRYTSQKIKAMGYEPFTAPKGPGTLVGLRFDPSKVSLEKALIDARSIDAAAFVYR